VSELHVEGEHRVTPLELFFDLVFVFAFTEVTTLMTNDLSWAGLGRGLLVLAALWWAWTGYAWLTNTIDPEDRGYATVALLVAMAAMFVAALAVPDAFDEHGVAFGVAFLIVRAMHLALYALSAGDDRQLLAAVRRLSLPTMGAALLIVLAGFTDDGLRIALWLLALTIDYLGPLVGRGIGWRVHPAHFAERHGLIVIIALGESFIAIGLGANVGGLDAGVIVAAVLGLAVATCFWLAYFDFFSIRGHQILVDSSGAQRAAFARDAYSYLHLPMVAGIVLFAVAVKQTLAHVGDELDTVAAFALCGGCAVYLSSYVLLRIRLDRKLSRGRFIALLAFLAVFPACTAVPALAALAIVAAVWIALHAYELIWWREARAQTRALRMPA